MYRFIERLHRLYGLLQDEQSKEIFQARFTFDMEPSMANFGHLGSLDWIQPWQEELKRLNREHKKIVLYGTANTGGYVSRVFQLACIDFYGFCGQDADMFPNGLNGKPVLTSDELVAHGDEYYVVLAVSTKKSYKEVIQFLQKSNYPKNHILDWVNDFPPVKQYFDFPALYRQGTMFIDGGCYDCDTSYRFAEWCGGMYSSIVAFEPDPNNYAKCCQNIQEHPLANFQLINAGLSSQEGTAVFDARGSASSHIIPSAPNSNKEEISIRTVAIDDIVGDRTVGFIKMDIEGAEFDALHGAKNTILRDKPLLAICVYHLRGDVFAIMDYLHELLPEYRFFLRHYSDRWSETVLYASVDL